MCLTCTAFSAYVYGWRNRSRGASPLHPPVNAHRHSDVAPLPQSQHSTHILAPIPQNALACKCPYHSSVTRSRTALAPCHHLTSYLDITTTTTPTPLMLLNPSFPPIPPECPASNCGDLSRVVLWSGWTSPTAALQHHFTLVRVVTEVSTVYKERGNLLCTSGWGNDEIPEGHAGLEVLFWPLLEDTTFCPHF